MRLTMPALFKASQPGTVVAEWHAYVTSMVRLKRRDARSIEPQRRRLCRTRSRRRLMRSPRSVQVAAAILAMLGSSVSMCGCGGGGGPADSGSDATRTQCHGTACSEDAESPDGGRSDSDLDASLDALLALPDTPDIDTPCPADGGVTARQLFGQLRRSYAATYTPERGSTGATGLRIGVSVSDGGIACMLSTSCAGEDAACGPASLSIELDLTFKTVDGTFNETFPVSANRVITHPSVGWSGTIPGTALKGKYKFALGTAAQVTMGFHGNFNFPADGETLGSITEETSTMNASSGMWQSQSP